MFLLISVDKLKEFGANVSEGLSRCMNNEAFYLRLVGMEMSDKNFGLLKDAVQNNDVKAAFEASHALKGALGNLSLTPLFEPASAITEKLRGASEMPDISELCQSLFDAYDRLKALAD